jgi:hypothetical protein
MSSWQFGCPASFVGWYVDMLCDFPSVPLNDLSKATRTVVRLVEHRHKNNNNIYVISKLALECTEITV